MTPERFNFLRERYCAGSEVYELLDEVKRLHRMKRDEIETLNAEKAELQKRIEKPVECIIDTLREEVERLDNRNNKLQEELEQEKYNHRGAGVINGKLLDMTVRLEDEIEQLEKENSAPELTEQLLKRNKELTEELAWLKEQRRNSSYLLTKNHAKIIGLEEDNTQLEKTNVELTNKVYHEINRRIRLGYKIEELEHRDRTQADTIKELREELDRRSKFIPKIIKNAADHKATMVRIEELMDVEAQLDRHLYLEEYDELDLLATLVEQWEGKETPIPEEESCKTCRFKKSKDECGNFRCFRCIPGPTFRVVEEQGWCGQYQQKKEQK